MLYSSLFLSFITTTDRVRLLIPTAKSKYACIGGDTGPVEKAVAKPISSLKKPKTNRTQAAMVAKALNLGGILLPPLDSVVKVYTPMGNFLNGAKQDGGWPTPSYPLSVLVVAHRLCFYPA